MSKQLQKLNYAPEEVEISVIGSSTPTTGTLTITQIKTLLASDQNYIKYTIAANMSEYLYFTNFTNNTAFYGADLYNATTSVYYRHLIKISYSSDLSSATWNYYNIPIITGSSSDLMTNPMTAANDLIIGGTSGAPTRLGLGTAGQVLKVNSAGTGLEYGAGGGSELDDNVMVELSIPAQANTADYNNRTYAEAIKLKDFITNCEAGTYTMAGTVARISNFINGKTHRIVLIGTNHDILANNTSAYAKTTWQFLDIPTNDYIKLGLPFNIFDKTIADIKAIINGTNTSANEYTGSNLQGYVSAMGLIDINHVVYESMPVSFQAAIKMVRKEYKIKANVINVAASGGGITYSEASRCYIPQKLFHMGVSEMDTSFMPNSGDGPIYSYLSASERRVRYGANGTAIGYWTRTPMGSGSSGWVEIYSNGGLAGTNVSSLSRVAPAFCI